jgi:hypothetical protein
MLRNFCCLPFLAMFMCTVLWLAPLHAQESHGSISVDCPGRHLSLSPHPSGCSGQLLDSAGTWAAGNSLAAQRKQRSLRLL